MKRHVLLASLLLVCGGSSLHAQGYKDPRTAGVFAMFVPAGDWLYRGQIPEFIQMAGLITGPAILGNNILKYCSPFDGQCEPNDYLKALGALFTIVFHVANWADAEQNTIEYNRSRGNLAVKWTPRGPAISFAFGVGRAR